MRYRPFSSRATQARLRLLSAQLLIAFAVVGSNVYAQATDQVTESVNATKLVALANHHPQWATQRNSTGVLPPDTYLNGLTLVLARSPQQEAALLQLLANQQDLASPEYHHWLTPTEMGEKFGVSEQDIATVTGWLQSQGLHVDWVSPSRMFVGFQGTAATVAHTFHTQFNTYHLQSGHNQAVHYSVASDPMIPVALAPVIKAVHGLYMVDDQPLHSALPMRSDSPELTSTNGRHFIAPADFDVIYDYPGGDVSGQTIGIVGRSRTDFADFQNYRQKTGTSFPDPVEIVPTAFGGVDPGPALTAPQTPASADINSQLEATLDVTNAGGISGNVHVLLVVATSTSGGIEADAQYLIQTTPLPAQVVSISYGQCESAAGPSGVSFWDTLFQQAAAEGISVFVSSGDAGASGCDDNFATPPVTPQPNSPNYICSSTYATCVGGTQFNDVANSSQYWGGNQPNLGSALSYIPEGAWNEPLTSAGGTQAAASAGGVSSIIATPSWQTGPGVPSARSGRYTPDVSFSSSAHNGYFACFAAAGSSCVSGADGAYQFEYIFGTSAAAPAMAAVAANLNTFINAPQGNLGPQLYQLATAVPNAFHDVTVVSSGVTACTVATPSLCNNTIPGPTGLAGGQQGYLVTAGYDQVTGLGSLDVANFINNYPALPTIKFLNLPSPVSPPTLSFPSQLLGYPTPGVVSIANSGSTALDPVLVTVSGANAADFVASSECASGLDPRTSCQLNVTFTPSAAGPRTAVLTITSANAVNSPQVVPLTGTGSTTLFMPIVTLSTSLGTINSTQAETVTILVISAAGVPLGSDSQPILPTGSVTLSTPGYVTQTAQLVQTTSQSEFATMVIPAGALPLGDHVLTATYTPDTASAKIYATNSGTTLVTVAVPAFFIEGLQLKIAPGATTNNTDPIVVGPMYGFTGSVALTAAITSAPASALHPPTLSFGTTSPVSLTTPQPATATLTVSTTPPTISALDLPAKHLRWYSSAAASLASLLLIASPARLRRWRRALALVVLCFLCVGGLSACGGSNAGSTGTTKAPPSGDPGTTPGMYTVTITGTSGTTMATTSISLQVQ